MPTPTGPRAPRIEAAELRDHLEDSLDHWFTGTRGWLPAVDLIRHPSELVARADVPGVKSDDLRIDATAIDARLEDGVLEVTLPIRPGPDSEPIQIRPSP